MVTAGHVSFIFSKALGTLQDNNGSMDITREKLLALTLFTTGWSLAH